MQTELPTMLNVFQDDYQLEYSESYSGTVRQETIIERYQYCISLQRAFESLIFDGYTNFRAASVLGDAPLNHKP